ncbi:hypothetical protein CRYUN_Cryun24cG0117600 [Craigia yunnanensis]
MEGKNMRVLVQAIMLLLTVALVVGQPGINTPPVPQTPPADGRVPPAIPGSDQLPSGACMLPPGGGIGGIDLPKRKCAGQCMRSNRNRFAAKICTSLRMLRCGIRMSIVVCSCTEN